MLLYFKIVDMSILYFNLQKDSVSATAKDNLIKTRIYEIFAGFVEHFLVIYSGCSAVELSALFFGLIDGACTKFRQKLHQRIVITTRTVEIPLCV